MWTQFEEVGGTQFEEVGASGQKPTASEKKRQILLSEKRIEFKVEEYVLPRFEVNLNFFGEKNED